MALSFMTRLKHAWNAFRSRDPTNYTGYGGSSFYPGRPRFGIGTERTIVTAIYNRLALDVASIDIRHVMIDENGKFVETIDDELNYCFTVEANIDQTSRAFIQDVVMSMFDEGYIAIVPIDTTEDPNITQAFKIHTMRVGKIVQWYPDTVLLKVYNDKIGQYEEITMLKSRVAIIENPLYAIMNEPNSTVKRLIRKLTLLDAVDEEANSGRFNLLIQLPYVLKSKLKQDEAKARRAEIEDQLSQSKYGIAYIDGTEHVTQLNRPLENGLMSQIEYLTDLLYSQLGITQDILNGTANDTTMTNYYVRSIEPIISAIVNECRRKFLTKTARSQYHSLMFFNNPFKLIPVSQIAEMADKLSRNEILSTNEIRALIGMLPSKDPRADELLNKNINHPEEEQVAKTSDNEEEISK